MIDFSKNSHWKFVFRVMRMNHRRKRMNPFENPVGFHHFHRCYHRLIIPICVEHVHHHFRLFPLQDHHLSIVQISVSMVDPMIPVINFVRNRLRRNPKIIHLVYPIVHNRRLRTFKEII